MDWLVADGVGAADLVGPGGDFGDGVRSEVGDEELAAVGFKGEVYGGLAYVEEGEQVVGGETGVLAGGPGVGGCGEVDGHDLVSTGAGDEGLGGVGEDDGVGGSGAAGDGCAEGQDLSVGRGWLVWCDVEDGDAAAGAVGDDEATGVRGDAGDAGLLTGAGDEDLAVMFEVEDADGIGAGVGDVAAAACGIDADEVRLAMDGDGGGDDIAFGVDDGDRPGLVGGAGVDDINLVTDGVCGEAGRVDAYLEGAVGAEIDEVEDADGVGGSVGDVGELTVASRDVGKGVAAATCGEGEESEGTGCWNRSAWH